MRRGLQSNETDNLDDRETDPCSSSSLEFDLLDLHICCTPVYKKKRNKKKLDGSGDLTQGIETNHPLRQILSDDSCVTRKEDRKRLTRHIPLDEEGSKVIVSVNEHRSSSVQSFQVSELSEPGEFDSPARIFINQQVSFRDERQAKDIEKQKQFCTSPTSLNISDQSRILQRVQTPEARNRRTYTTKDLPKKEKVVPPLRSDSNVDKSSWCYQFQSATVSARATHSDVSLASFSGKTVVQSSRQPHTSRCRPKHRMAQQEPNSRSDVPPQDTGHDPNEEHSCFFEPHHITASRKEAEECRRTFPFQPTPSGNLKVVPNQVVFESNKVSVLVADPKHTIVNVKGEDGTTNLIERRRPSIMVLNPGHPDGPFQFHRRHEDEYYHSELEDTSGKSTDTREEINLSRLGLSASEPIDWTNIVLPDKSDVHKLVYHRIINFVNPDCIVRIGNEEFQCHHLVLQCYSTYFDKEYFHEVQLPESNVTPKAFATIYHWMIYDDQESFHFLKRNNVLEIFMAAQFLGVKELEDQCWAFIDCEDIFSEGTAFLLYLDAKKLGNTTVMELMIPRIMTFFLTLVSSKDFLELSVDELCVILQSNYIYVHSEMEVFMSAVRWLMYDWEHRKEVLSEVMSCIRFGLIAPWQLIDIRRNPENPEFIEISSNPSVRQFIEDGLAFATIKFYYENQEEDYNHWINLLGMSEPAPRNWFPEQKNYITYREFLHDLDVYRQKQMMEKKYSKANNGKKQEPQEVPTALQNLAFMSSQESHPLRNRSLSSLPKNLVASFPTPPPHLSQTGEQQHMLDKCTSTDYVPEESCSSFDLGARESDFKSVDDMDTTMTSTELENLGREILQAQKRRDKLETDQGKELLLRTVDLSSSDTLPIDSHARQKIIPQVNKNFTEGKRRTIIGEEPISLYSLVTNKAPLRNMHEISSSMIGPANKDYMADGSLYLYDREAILVFGGVDPHSQYGVGHNTGKGIFRYQPDVNIWESVGELPEPRHHHCVAFLRGRVYLVGGADPRDDDIRGKSVVTGTVWSYELVSRSWFSERGMQYPRKNFGLVTYSGKLYAIGGQDRQGRLLSSVECFDPKEGVWAEVAPLAMGRMGIAATKFRDLIWVAGGMTASKMAPLCRNVDCYDPKLNTWMSYSELRFPRCFARLFTVNDKLYLIGGAGRVTEREQATSSVAAIDILDTHRREWCLQAEMSIPRHGHSVAYVGRQMVIIGGVTTVYMRALKNVECYCTERGTWIRGISNLPIPLSGHASVTLPPASYL